jgi:hypothetical protein
MTSHQIVTMALLDLLLIVPRHRTELAARDLS